MKLNVLPQNPDGKEGVGRFPSWLHRKMPKGGNVFKTGEVLKDKRLHTVCEEARCPNILECWSKKTATFLTMGKQCTRNCGFCSIDFAVSPKPLEGDEPQRIAESVQALSLKHVVLTMVARDDLVDGGAAHLKAIVQQVRLLNPATTIELLTSDFCGNESAWNIILEAQPEILNYNIETVRLLTPRIRHKATYERTLALLKYMKAHANYPILTKSGLMLGLGEEQSQVFESLDDLKRAGCDIITIGQYLQPTSQKLLVKAFITPEEFQGYEDYGHRIGIPHVYAGPFVRSSYNAETVLQKVYERNRRSY